ncbi:hypothetical protein [Bacillus cereus]|uniref:hypothetical protein n=1 Tax=Bacillus cereus TaxID=1396 RepID=UPI001596106A|nr:hypothetical protein [Bacillus cereus]
MIKNNMINKKIVYRKVDGIMFKSHSNIKTPADEVKIWRYMDFTKFVSLLDQRMLFLTRSDKFLDKFEGTYPTLIESRRSDISNQDIAHKIVEVSKELKKRTFVNCWHKNEYESAAMWNLYLKSEEGIAIQSTVGKLKESLNQDEKDLYIGEVRYINYNVDYIEGDCHLKPFVHKRNSFEHEKEIRILYQLDKQVEFDDVMVGEQIDCNLDALIENIYVAPESPGWFKDVVTSICNKYDIDVQVKQSKLKEVAY